MKRKQGIGFARATGVLLAGILVMFAGGASAHCDSMTGPVVPDARAALESGDLAPVLKWIMPEYEAEVSDAFQRAVEVRALGEDARELADRYFLETLIRVHREGEGAPYTGLKDDPAAPIVQMADQALADGSVEGMMEKINRHLASVVGEKFQAALEAGKNGTGPSLFGVVGVVWTGRDDNAPMDKIVGGGAPAIIWREAMSRALEGRHPPIEIQTTPSEPEESDPLAALIKNDT